MSKAEEPKFNLWTMCVDPLTDWHVIEGNSGLSHLEADRRELLGNRLAEKYGVGLRYMAQIAGLRPSTPAGYKTAKR